MHEREAGRQSGRSRRECYVSREANENETDYQKIVNL
jgi:hypothetical protein